MRVSAPLSNPAQAVGQVLSMFVLHLPASRTSVSQWHTAIRTIEFISASNYSVGVGAKENLPKHLMNLLQKEKNLFPHLHFQTHIMK